MDSQVFIELHQDTKDALLRFLLDEKSMQEKSRSIILRIFKGNLEISKDSLENLLEKLDLNIEELDQHIIKILQAQSISKVEEDPQLSLLNLDPQEAIEKMKAIIPLNTHNDIKEFCNSGEAEKIIEGLIEHKVESFFSNKISNIENRFEDKNNSIAKLENCSKNEKKAYINSRYFVLSIIALLLALIYYSVCNYEISEYNSVVESNEIIINLNHVTEVINLDSLEKRISLFTGLVGICSLAFIPIDKSFLYLHFNEYKGKLCQVYKLDANYNLQELLRFPFEMDSIMTEIKPIISYLDGYVYCFYFGNYFKYNYQTKSFVLIKHSPELSRYYFSSAVGFKNHILIVPYTDFRLISYDIDKDSFNKIEAVGFTNNSIPNSSSLKIPRIIFTTYNRAYIIELPGNIYQSEVNNFTNWKIIGASSVSCSRYFSSYVVKYKERIYFACDSGSSKLAECDIQKGIFCRNINLRN